VTVLQLWHLPIDTAVSVDEIVCCWVFILQLSITHYCFCLQSVNLLLAVYSETVTSLWNWISIHFNSHKTYKNCSIITASSWFLKILGLLASVICTLAGYWRNLLHFLWYSVIFLRYNLVKFGGDLSGFLKWMCSTQFANCHLRVVFWSLLIKIVTGLISKSYSELFSEIYFV